MTDLEQFTQLPADFDGRVRLFPLPELVVFPNAMQPLHIFEPRYCEMLEESLASDRLIAMATLPPGWHETGGRVPPIAPHVCISRIVSHAVADEDRHNVLAVGLRRARIVQEEEDTGRSFRTARVEVIDDVYPVSGVTARPALKRQLLDAFRALIPDVAEVQKNLHELMSSQMRLGAVTDIIGFTMQFEGSRKLELLGEANVDRRANMLIDVLDQRAAEAAEPPALALPENSPFPPPFSVN
jgi:ATP-dependent Lon protease